MQTKIKFIALFILTLFCFNLQAKVNVDSIFNIAVSHSRSANYESAILEANTALTADSLRADIAVFIANVYSWKNSNDTAMLYLNKARKLNYLNSDFYDASLNILFRAKKYDKLLTECADAEANKYGNKINVATKRLLAYEGLQTYREITTMLEKPENKDLLVDKSIAYIYQQAKEKIRFQSFTMNYNIDFFESIAPHHLASIAYTNKLKSVSTGLGLNYANRYGKNDAQVEYVGYKILKNENYWYLNYGYAFNGSLFPKHRTGLEYYFKIAPKWDASLGGRYLFYPFANDKNIWILTGNIGTYIQKSWITVRPFYVMRQDIQSLSVALKYRLYDENPLSFWGLEVGLGNSPDDMYAVSQGSFNKLMAYRIKMEKNIPLKTTSDLFFGFGYVYEEVFQSTQIVSRNRFVLDIGFRHKF